MFSLQSFSAQKAGVCDGAVSIALAKLRGLLTDLLHNPETGVVYCNSSDSTNIIKGQVVAYNGSAANSVEKAIFGGAPQLEKGFAICLNNTVEPGEWGFFRFAGVADVRLVALTPVGPGDVIFVSIISGLCTTDVGNRQIGVCLNSNDYSPINPIVRVLLKKCCLQGARPPNSTY